MRWLISLKKGGIVTATQGPAWVSDFGWIVELHDEQFVTHWWSDHWASKQDGQSFIVTGSLVSCREQISSPLKHFLLRAASYTLGRQLIGKLKKNMIFRKTNSPYTFERTITMEANRIHISDKITGLPATAQIVAAPRASKRHVASADSFHREDLAMRHLVTFDQKTEFINGTFSAETTYTFPKNA